jgi:hypothetical protein
MIAKRPDGQKAVEGDGLVEGIGRVDEGQVAPPAGVAGKAEGRRPWVLHPFLIAAFPIISLYAHNVYETSPAEMVRPLAVSLGSTAFAWLAFRLVSRDSAKAGLCASLLVATAFSFKMIRDGVAFAWIAVMHLWVYTDYPLNPLILMAVLGLANLAVVIAIIRRTGRPDRLTNALNAFTLILVALPTVTAISSRVGQPASKPREGDRPMVAASKRGWTPDIYFIVLDGYARSDVMKDLFDFDNTPFLDRLERQGFFVARNSFSNYCQTRLSIASTLNVQYLDRLLDLSSPDLLPITDLIRENFVRKSLKPLGYRFVSFSTGFEPTDFPDSDIFLQPRPGNPEFSQILLEMTPVDAWRSRVEKLDRYSAQRDRTLFLLDRLPGVAAVQGPTFTFAHLLAPHPPFVFGPNGEDVSPRWETRQDGRIERTHAERFGTPEYFRAGYHDESAFLTASVERAVERILASSPEPPIIVLQSDHGSWLRYHPDDAEKTDLRERFGILNCIYTAGRKVPGLTDSMTSINTFRVLLREIIGADLPPLEERNYFSPFHFPLVFTDVTERLHSPEERKRTFTYPDQYHGLEQQF